MKKFWHKIRQSTFFIKWTQWEYYPIYIINIPTVFIWLYFALRARNLFFFSTVNPDIENGGVMGDSKYNIVQKIPAKFLPVTLFFPKNNQSEAHILQQIAKQQLSYPLIAKPDIGERGFLVKKIKNEQELKNYIRTTPTDFMIQEFVNFPVELGVFYYRFPNCPGGTITSICMKDTLKVTGDGQSTIRQLMHRYPRARFQLARFEKEAPLLLEKIPANGQIIELEPIGNHSRGATFLNANYINSPQLEHIFDHINRKMGAIYYGRFDLKCESIAALQQGNFKILEFNGVKGEPAHIYDPDYSTLQAYRDIYQHWKIIYQIATIQMQKGVYPISSAEAIRFIKNYFKYKRSLSVSHL